MVEESDTAEGLEKRCGGKTHATHFNVSYFLLSCLRFTSSSHLSNMFVVLLIFPPLLNSSFFKHTLNKAHIACLSAFFLSLLPLSLRRAVVVLAMAGGSEQG